MVKELDGWAGTVTSDFQDPNLAASPTPGVGALLRETRKSLGRELPAVAATLRIRQPFLEAIEDSRFRDLPGATYAIGFVRGYADYLGLDSTEIVRRFKLENSDLARGNHLVFPSAISEGGIPTGALLGFALVAAVVLYFGWHWYQGHEQATTEASSALPDRLTTLMREPVGNGTEIVTVKPSTPPATDSAPSTAPAPAPVEPQAQTPAAPPAAVPQTAAPQAVAPEVPVPAPAAAPLPKPEPKAKAPKTATAPTPAPATSETLPELQPGAAAPAASPEKPAVPAHHGRVLLVADDQCWIKVLDATGKVVSSHLLKAGETYYPPSHAGLTMTVGNAGALKISVDGKELPALGGLGMVRHDIPLDANRLLGKPSGDEPSPTEPTGDMPTPEKSQ
jgi:cytoskeleton protein RodZ